MKLVNIKLKWSPSKVLYQLIYELNGTPYLETPEKQLTWCIVIQISKVLRNYSIILYIMYYPYSMNQLHSLSYTSTSCQLFPLILIINQPFPNPIHHPHSITQSHSISHPTPNHPVSFNPSPPHPINQTLSISHYL